MKHNKSYIHLSHCSTRLPQTFEKLHHVCTALNRVRNNAPFWAVLVLHCGRFLWTDRKRVSAVVKVTLSFNLRALTTTRDEKCSDCSPIIVHLHFPATGGRMLFFFKTHQPFPTLISSIHDENTLETFKLKVLFPVCWKSKKNKKKTTQKKQEMCHCSNTFG